MAYGARAPDTYNLLNIVKKTRTVPEIEPNPSAIVFINKSGKRFDTKKKKRRVFE